MYDPKEDFKFNVRIWLVILATLAAIVVAAAIISEVVAAPNGQDADQPEFISATFIGEGPLSVNLDLTKNHVQKPKGSKKFEFVEVTEVYPLGEGDRLWETNADEAPQVLYQQTINLGQVKANCVIDFLVLDDDIDDRINNFSLNGEVVTLNQGMVVSGKLVVPADGELMFTANDSIALWVGICVTKITPTPTMTLTPTATNTPTATATNTPTATATPGSGISIVYLPLVTGKNEPPATETPTPFPTATHMPAGWYFTGTYADPHWWSDVFTADTIPFWQDVPQQTAQTHWQTGRQYALVTNGVTIEFVICEYEQNVDVICALFVNGKEVKTDLFEVIEIDLGEVFLFVGEDYCLGGPCLHVQTWWKQDLQAHGLLVDLFAEIQRAKAAVAP